MKSDFVNASLFLKASLLLLVLVFPHFIFSKEIFIAMNELKEESLAHSPLN